MTEVASFQSDLRRRKRRFLLILGGVVGTVLLAAVGIALYVLAQIGHAMGGDDECIPKSLPDGGTYTEAPCVHGRKIPSVPSRSDAGP